MKKIYKTILITICTFSIFIACNPKKMDDLNSTKIVTINNIDFELNSNYQLYTWEKLPKNIFFERKNIQEFTNQSREKKYYEVVYIISANLSWYQAAYLAQNAGGQLVTIENKEEELFISNIVSDNAWGFKNWTKNMKNISTYGKDKNHQSVSGFIIEYHRNN